MEDGDGESGGRLVVGGGRDGRTEKKRRNSFDGDFDALNIYRDEATLRRP